MKPEKVRFRLKGKGNTSMALNNFDMLASVSQEKKKDLNIPTEILYLKLICEVKFF